jgi:Aspartyl/Asparaginyl beta-hydroxylase
MMYERNHFELLLSSVDVAPLLAELNKHPDAWNIESRRERHPGSPHAQAQSILIRWSASQDPQTVMDSVECVDMPAITWLEGAIGPIFEKLLERIGADGSETLGRVMLTRLQPGAAILAHSDEGRYADHYERFHVCLSGDGGNVFKVGGLIFRPSPGSVWWFNHKKEHSVENMGTAERIHLIFDITSPAWKAKRGVYFQQERFRHLEEEVHPLLKEHWQEIAKYKDIPLSPDRERYDTLEAIDVLRCYTARDCGELIGYAAFLKTRHLHYDVLTAQQDVLFLSKRHRIGRTGLNLIRYAERRLQAEGVELIMHHVKTTNGAGRIMEALGYEEVDRVYMKRMGPQRIRE